MQSSNQKDIRRYLSVIKRAVAYIEASLESDDGKFEEMILAEPISKLVIVETGIPPVIEVKHDKIPEVLLQQPKGPTPEQVAARKDHISRLMAIDCWPEAVPVFFQAKHTDEDQINRANAVLDMMIDTNIEGRSFLDFGCGEGWIAQQVMKRGVIESVGYDLVETSNWRKCKGPLMTTKLSDLKSEYFDAIMVYDVLDHAQDPMQVMAEVRRCLKPTGSVYVRCHPWTSRHGSHLYPKGINKAYLQLFLNWFELRDLLGEEPMFTRMEKNPVEAYHWWFKEFTIKRERKIVEPVNEFFKVPSFKELLANEQQILMDQIDEFIKLMEIQFVDFCLVPKK